jgi:hypothetical protein
MIYHSFNELHLGDNVFHMDLLRKLSIKYPEHIFYHYAQPYYLDELVHHIVGYEDKIFLFDCATKPPEAVNCWIGAEDFIWRDPEFTRLNEFYIRWFNHYCAKIGLENPVTTVVSDYEQIKLKHNTLDKYYDILLINSDGHSGQFPASQGEFLALANTLAQKYSIVTTQHLPGYPCTVDWGYNLVDIGALAINCRFLIAVQTSCHILAVSKWSMETLERIYTLDKNPNCYIMDKIISIKGTHEFHKIISELL